MAEETEDAIVSELHGIYGGASLFQGGSPDSERRKNQTLSQPAKLFDFHRFNLFIDKESQSSLFVAAEESGAT